MNFFVHKFARLSLDMSKNRCFGNEFQWFHNLLMHEGWLIAMQTYIQNCSNASESVTSYATIIIDIFEITALGENHINKPKKPAVCTLWQNNGRTWLRLFNIEDARPRVLREWRVFKINTARENSNYTSTYVNASFIARKSALKWHNYRMFWSPIIVLSKQTIGNQNIR